MKSVLIAGGTGFIGSALKNLLQTKGYNVKIVSRTPGPDHIVWLDVKNNRLPENIEAIVNVTGQNVLNPFKRWSNNFKKEVVNSRVTTTQTLVNAIRNSANKPKAFISVSGVGIYKPGKDTVYDEKSEVGASFDFISNLAHKWENAANIPGSDVRQVIIRSGVVLGRTGGMIKQVFLPFYLGLGGPLGEGTQYFPWIHVDDLCRLFLLSIENNNVKGILNGVAPQIITNKEFTVAFGKALHRPTFMPAPEFAVRLIFGSDRATMILEGQKVVPNRVTQEYSFKYLYPTIDKACNEFSKLLYQPKLLQ